LKPAAKKLVEEQKPHLPEKFERITKTMSAKTGNHADFDRLSDIFHLLLVNSTMNFKDNEELVVRQKLSIYNRGTNIQLHELVMPIDLVSFKTLLRQMKCCSNKFHQ
jgi:hypothetical protein